VPRPAGRQTAGIQNHATGRIARRFVRPAPLILEDVVDGGVTVTIHDGGSDTLHDRRRLYAAETIWLTARDDDPGQALLIRTSSTAGGNDHTIEIRARSTQASTATEFDLSVDLGSTSTARRFQAALGGAIARPVCLSHRAEDHDRRRRRPHSRAG
jgi:hypothetical protein